jgi:hypothetical protein
LFNDWPDGVGVTSYKTQSPAGLPLNEKRMPEGILMFTRFAANNCQQMLSRFGDDVDTTTFAVEHDIAINESKQSVIFALADAFARMPLVANLTNQDVASGNGLTAELFDSATLCV